MELSRISSGKIELRRGPVDLAAVLKSAVEASRPLIEDARHALEFVLPDEPLPLDADVVRLTQVFVNLLANATDAAPEGSDLTLTSSVLPTGMWRCRLQNGGAAIPPDVLPRVFEIFFSTKPGGTGIGLPLCQRVIEEHGGIISLESAPECGTTATVVLPLVSA